MWDTIKKFMKNYLTQPSTWRGMVTLVAGIFGLTFAPETQEQLVQYLVGVGGGAVAIIGLIEVVRNERKKPE